MSGCARVRFFLCVCLSPSKVPHLMMNIGDYVSVGEGSIVRACDIRSCVRIGANCIVVSPTF